MTPTRGSADNTAIPAVFAGTTCWLVALIALTLTDGASPPSNGIWWWGVCAVGTLSGVLGLAFVIRRSRRRFPRQ